MPLFELCSSIPSICSLLSLSLFTQKREASAYVAFWPLSVEFWPPSVIYKSVVDYLNHSSTVYLPKMASRDSGRGVCVTRSNSRATTVISGRLSLSSDQQRCCTSKIRVGRVSDTVPRWDWWRHRRDRAGNRSAYGSPPVLSRSLQQRSCLNDAIEINQSPINSTRVRFLPIVENLPAHDSWDTVVKPVVDSPLPTVWPDVRLRRVL